MGVYEIKKRTKSEAQTGDRNHAFGKFGSSSKRYGKSHTETMKREFAKKRIGIGNPHWKGGITDLTNRIRQIREYKFWKKSCLQRDKVCQDCYSTNHLEVDHIEPLTALLKLHKIASVEAAKACQELWDITNGLTLCHSCHRKKHFKS
jgi:hypothetical protein